MMKANLLRIDGIGEPTAAKLVADGVTTTSELKTAPQAVVPSTRHIYLSTQVTVLVALGLSTIGASTVSQYTRQRLG